MNLLKSKNNVLCMLNFHCSNKLNDYFVSMTYVHVSQTVKPGLSSHSKRRPKFGFQDRLSLNAGQKYCRMLQGEHSAIVLLTFIKLPFAKKTLFCIFEWPFKTGFTVT